MLLKREHSLLNCLKTLSVGPTRVWTPDLLHSSPILKQLSQLVGRLPCSGQNMYNRALDFGIKRVVDGETLPWPRVDTWNLFDTKFQCVTSQLVQQYRNSPFSCLKYSSRTLIIALVSIIIFCQWCIYSISSSTELIPWNFYLSSTGLNSIYRNPGSGEGFFSGFAFCWTLPFIMMNSYSSTGNLFVFNLQIDSCCKLSGMPDLSLCFVNSRLLEDPSFHPCVRLKRWEVSITVNLC